MRLLSEQHPRFCDNSINRESTLLKAIKSKVMFGDKERKHRGGMMSSQQEHNIGERGGSGDEAMTNKS